VLPNTNAHITHDHDDTYIEQLLTPAPVVLVQAPETCGLTYVWFLTAVVKWMAGPHLEASPKIMLKGMR
jgi:hypothetical protein